MNASGAPPEDSDERRDGLAPDRDRRLQGPSTDLYLRSAVLAEPDAEKPPVAHVRAWLTELDRTGRLVAAGWSDTPPGHLLLLRARDAGEAARVLRSDPFVGPGIERSITRWRVDAQGTGVNLEPPPARGAGRLTVLDRISVFVSDPAASRRWYLDVLGLTVRAEDPATEFLELALGAGAAGLVLVHPRPEWGPPHYEEGRRRIGRATGIAFRTDNVEALALRLEHAGRRPLEGPRDEPWGGRSLRFADPDGNEFVAFDPGPARPVSLPPRPRRLHRRKDPPVPSMPLYAPRPPGRSDA